MYNEISISPLQGVLNAGHEVSYDAEKSVDLKELAVTSIVQIDCWHGKEADLFAVFKEKLQIEGAMENGSVWQTTDFFVMNTSPGSYMAVSYTVGIWDYLNDLISDDIAVMTDLSHSRSVLSVSGAGVLDVLSKGMNIDLDETVFPINHVKQTSIAHMGVTCYRADKDDFKLFVFRGFAQSFYQWLTHSAHDVGYRTS